MSHDFRRKPNRGDRPPKPDHPSKPRYPEADIVAEAMDRHAVDVVEAIDRHGLSVSDGLKELIEVLRAKPEPQPCPWRSQGPFISAVHGRRCDMPHVAEVVVVPKMLDVEKVLLSTMPRKADGTIDTAAVNAWTSSDPGIVAEPGTEPFEFEGVTCPGSFNCWALTPGEVGAASVTSKIAGYADVEFQVSYAHGVALSQNPSVGTPVADA